MNDEIRMYVERMLSDALEPIHQEFIEQSARLSAQRFLLEMVYANSFISNGDGFNTFMDGLMKMTREHVVKSGPMKVDDATELQARIATHLERFQSAVSLRISQGLKK